MNEANENIGDFLGYIKLYRSFEDWEWYGDQNTKGVFIHLILHANIEDKQWKGDTIKRGQFVTSLERLSEPLCLSIQQIRTCLSKLERTGEITRKATNKYTLITICNYYKYQSFANSINKQITNEQQTNNKQITTTKEYKNIRILSDDAVIARARTREGPEVRPIQEFVEELKADRIWLEAICMNNQIKPDQIESYINAFLTECTANGNEMHINEKEAKSHFNSWLRIRKEAERKKQNEDNRRNLKNESPTEQLQRILSGNFRS